jgi:putative Holliday junction resolvase
MRVMGCDFGSKTIGVAMSDPTGLIAQALETVHRQNPVDMKASIERLAQLCDSYQVERLVVGLPKNMNNSEGERVAATQEFIRRLKKRIDLPVETWDERLSTRSAQRTLDEGQVARHHQKEVIDQVAATHILQNYLDAGSRL